MTRISRFPSYLPAGSASYSPDAGNRSGRSAAGGFGDLLDSAFYAQWDGTIFDNLYQDAAGTSVVTAAAQNVAHWKAVDSSSGSAFADVPFGNLGLSLTSRSGYVQDAAANDLLESDTTSSSELGWNMGSVVIGARVKLTSTWQPTGMANNTGLRLQSSTAIWFYCLGSNAAISTVPDYTGNYVTVVAAGNLTNATVWVDGVKYFDGALSGTPSARNGQFFLGGISSSQTAGTGEMKRVMHVGKEATDYMITDDQEAAIREWLEGTG